MFLSGYICAFLNVFGNMLSNELYGFLCLFIFWAGSLHWGVKQMCLEQMTDHKSHQKGILKEYFPFLVNYIPRTDQVLRLCWKSAVLWMLFILMLARLSIQCLRVSLQSNYRDVVLTGKLRMVGGKLTAYLSWKDCEHQQDNKLMSNYY